MEERRVCESRNYQKRSHLMAPAHILLAATLLFFTASFASALEKQAFQVKKQPELQQIKPKKPVKIRLKRTAKDEYSWELSGDDVDDIVRTDQRLRKVLNVK
jgi:hypothetical protein